jgi:hypothetical protein
LRQEAIMGRTVLAVVAAMILVGGSALFAHHSYGEFFLDRTMSIEGDIRQIRFGNPHVVLQIQTGDARIYTATWGPLYQMERSGVKATTLKIGDHVIVSGAPPRDPARPELMPVWKIRRPSDGWTWQSQRGPILPN